MISPSKSFTVYAATASEKTEWMAHIDKCAQDLRTKRKLRVVDCLCPKRSALAGRFLFCIRSVSVVHARQLLLRCLAVFITLFTDTSEHICFLSFSLFHFCTVCFYAVD